MHRSAGLGGPRLLGQLPRAAPLRHDIIVLCGIPAPTCYNMELGVCRFPNPNIITALLYRRKIESLPPALRMALHEYVL